MDRPFIVQGLDGIARRYNEAGELQQAGRLDDLVARFPDDQVIELVDEPQQVAEVRRLEALYRQQTRPAGVQVAP